MRFSMLLQGKINAMTIENIYFAIFPVTVLKHLLKLRFNYSYVQFFSAQFWWLSDNPCDVLQPPTDLLASPPPGGTC